MFRFIKFLKPKDFFVFAVLICLVVGEVYFDIFLPSKLNDLMGLFAQGPGIEPSYYQITIKSVIMLAYTVGSCACLVLVGLAASYIAANYSYYLSNKMFEHVNKLSLREISRFTIPSLLTRNTNDITKMQKTFRSFLVLFIAAPATAAGGIIVALTDSKYTSSDFSSLNKLLWISVGIIISIVVAMAIFIVIVLPKFKATQKATDQLNNSSREIIGGVRVVRAFNAQKYENQKFLKINDNLTKLNSFTISYMEGMVGTITILISLLTPLTYLVAALLFSWGDVGSSPAVMSSIMTYMMLGQIITFAFIRTIMLLIIVPQSMASSKRVKEVFAAVPDMSYSQETTGTFSSEGSVSFKNVDFKYGGAEDKVLDDLNFDIKKGETLAIIGHTGSGKSTIINLLFRMYDVTKGSVEIDGLNIKNISEYDLAKKLCIVPQKAFLFNASIEDNIAYGLEGIDEKEKKQRVEWAAEISQSTEFINKQPNKFKTVVTQNATNLSGGQKQRIAIARAIAVKPEILVFDDSFSALDMKTDQTLRKAISEKLTDVTKIIVGQRISTIKDANQILVISSGKIVGHGTHKHLLNKCKEYRDIALSQMTRKEVEHAANA